MKTAAFDENLIDKRQHRSYNTFGNTFGAAKTPCFGPKGQKTPYF